MAVSERKEIVALSIKIYCILKNRSVWVAMHAKIKYIRFVNLCSNSSNNSDHHLAQYDMIFFLSQLSKVHHFTFRWIQILKRSFQFLKSLLHHWNSCQCCHCNSKSDFFGETILSSIIIVLQFWGTGPFTILRHTSVLDNTLENNPNLLYCGLNLFLRLFPFVSTSVEV